MSTKGYVRIPGQQWRSYDTGAYFPIGDTGYPNATNTGPSGTLTLHVGNYSATPNEVVENLEIVGTFRADDGPATLRNCLVRSGDYWPCWMPHGGLLEDVQIIGGDNSQSTVFIVDGVLRRVNLSGAGDGIRMGRSLLEDSFIHSPGGNPSEAHNDMVELLGGSQAVNNIVRHNTIKNPRGQTSCLMMSEFGVQPNANVLIDDNYFAGAGYTIYGASSTDNVQGITVTNNVFSTEYFEECGQYGPIGYWPGEGNTWADNVWFDGPQAGELVTI